MLTPWGEKLDRTHVWEAYPRPQMVRESYLNLNGEWDYAITDTPDFPERFDGVILVPFSPESALSGVGRTLLPEQYLWYRKIVELPEGFRQERLLLHFGAVDQRVRVWVNGRELMCHTGGYTPFCVDVSEAVTERRVVILLQVTDGSEKNGQTRGKQQLDRGGIWHTAQSGIWQSVWLESVPENYIRGLRIKPHLDEGTVELWVAGEGTCVAELEGREETFTAGRPAVLKLEEIHPWSPETPYLYPLKLTLGTDAVESYFALRKFSVETDDAGCSRLFLNNRPYFQNGVLDQGYWPDGLLTAPSDEAMVFDIQTAKSMGFNMLRKHVKIEPLRWYYHCDRLGMLVWQDMPNGGETNKKGTLPLPGATSKRIKDGKATRFGRSGAELKEQYAKELREMVNALYNCPCVCVWTAFNEGWGELDAAAACEQIHRMDDSRPVDPVSGGRETQAGDLYSEHNYSAKYSFHPEPGERAAALSAFGSYAYRLEGHCFGEKTYGRRRFDSANSYQFALRNTFKDCIAPAAAQGLSAAVYTQLTDVEDELDGLITYDRRVIKIPTVILKNLIKIGK